MGEQLPKLRASVCFCVYLDVLVEEFGNFFECFHTHASQQCMAAMFSPAQHTCHPMICFGQYRMSLCTTSLLLSRHHRTTGGKTTSQHASPR